MVDVDGHGVRTRSLQGRPRHRSGITYRLKTWSVNGHGVRTRSLQGRPKPKTYKYDASVWLHCRLSQSGSVVGETMLPTYCTLALAYLDVSQLVTSILAVDPVEPINAVLSCIKHFEDGTITGFHLCIDGVDAAVLALVPGRALAGVGAHAVGACPAVLAGSRGAVVA